MQRVLRISCCVLRGAHLALLVGLLAACGLGAPAGPQIRVENVWSRPAVAMSEMGSGQSHSGEGGMGSTGVVYLTLINEGHEADRLIEVRSDVAEAVELHRTKMMEGGVMKMEPLTGGVEIPAGGRVAFKPGGYHIMLIGLKRDLQVGDRFAVTLEFEKSGVVTVESEVREP